ncbi:AraC family transcriptional regulator [Sinomicrobium pectinilyticum]|uniref:AraC family transcriptional regulator n=1 Tax=Sinomicrobium pectinilyticum TaxID=1084421 RepID=A0A3N0EK06_SINP1|nr:AraC family transcriptional regulator [Sinomicrobium pectinilyticum]RNL88236.1 AraC family transcriptional regulator [Sinomicrobium pectinilyticum]
MAPRHIDINTKGRSFNFGNNTSAQSIEDITDSCTTFNEPEIAGWIRETLLEDFKVILANLKISERPLIRFTYSGKAIEMLFVTTGSFEMHFTSHNDHHVFNKHTHNLLFSNKATGYFQPDNNDLRFVCIQLKRDFFEKFLPSDDSFNVFRKMIRNGQTGCIKSVNYPITPEMHFLLTDIIRSTEEDRFRKTFLYARILELLLLQTEQYGDPEAESLKDLSPSDREKIYKAKAYLLKNYGQKITLQGLAKKIGTNEFLLKNGFKTAFGTTVFGCIHHLRMTKAKKLLLEQKLTISQISDITGYKNPQHFSTAFKKKFGMTPSKLKQR